jgi:NAD(P)-dependent dehydrogenase (short-subunit alcohol dehydrogenase family)
MCAPEKQVAARDAETQGARMNVSGTVAVVTGGASGLGAGAARALAEAGAKVVVLDRARAEGERLARAIGGEFAAVNVSEEPAVRDAFRFAATLGEIRVLVTCAGIVAGEKIASKGTPHSLEQFARTVAVNLTGTFLCAAAAAAHMQTLAAKATGERGVIVMTSSISAFEGQVGQVAYAASKGGVAAMALPMARDLARDGIRAMAVAPGMFDTAMVAGLPPNLRESLVAHTLFPHRLGHPAEFGALVRHICENPMMNGEVVRLDGALRMQPR